MDIKILVAAHKAYWMPENPVYLPLQVGAEGKPKLGYTPDNTGDNISAKNPCFCELTGLYWAWKNLDCEYIGLCHYRRYFGKTIHTERLVGELYPEYSKAFTQVMNRRSLHILNMFVMKKSLFDAYCQWLFPILFAMEKQVDITGYSPYEQRLYGFLSERLFNVWLEKQQLKTCEVPVVFLEKIDWVKKGTAFLQRKFRKR